MPEQHNKFREPAFVGPAWRPYGTPFSDAGYRRANLPVSTQKQLAHGAEMERWISEMMARHDTD